MGSFAFDFQCQIVLCALMTHNFIRRNQTYEDEYDQIQEADCEQAEEVVQHEIQGADIQGAALRNIIAQQMWADYN
jgi:hypothetical protein